MNFDIPVHSSTKSASENFISNPSHALIISGPEGYGAQELGFFIANSIAGSESSIIPILPNEKQIITLEAIHDLISSSRYKNVQEFGKYSRIFIICTAESMTSEAQNAFLKLLEEPPLGTMFILVSHNKQKLLETITSRAQVIHMHPITKSQAMEHLTSNLGYTNDEANNIYLALGGKVATLEHKNKELDIFKNLQEAKRIISLPVFKRLIAVKNLSSNREQAINLVSDISAITKIALEKTALGNNANSTLHWIDRSEIVEKTLSNLNSNGNVRLSLDYLLINY